MSTVVAVDPRGWLHHLPLAASQRSDQLPLEPGWRFATRTEIDTEHQLAAGRLAHGAIADTLPEPAAEYRLAAELAARVPFRLDRDDLIALNRAAIGEVRQPVKVGSVYPIAEHRRGLVNVEAELAAMLEHVAALVAAGRYLAAAAYIGWRLTWLHPFAVDGNGRTSRAATYMLLLAGSEALRDAHRRRVGAVGRATLTVPERIERSRTRYLERANAMHAASALTEGYARTVDSSAFERRLTELAADQVAGRESPEDPPLPCAVCAARNP